MTEPELNIDDLLDERYRRTIELWHKKETYEQDRRLHPYNLYVAARDALDELDLDERAVAMLLVNWTESGRRIKIFEWSDTDFATLKDFAFEMITAALRDMADDRDPEIVRQDAERNDRDPIPLH